MAGKRRQRCRTHPSRVVTPIGELDMAGKDLSTAPLESFRLAELEPLDLIAPNFRVYELTRSETASRLRIDNDFTTDDELRAAVNLAREVLQPIRAAFGVFTPNSVYRGQALERALKNRPSSWISTSQHAQGCACDV